MQVILLLVLAVATLFGNSTTAEGPIEVITCDTQNFYKNSTFKITNKKTGMLSIRKPNGTFTNCPLSVGFITDASSGIVPSIDLSLDLENCNMPKDLGNKILKKIYLNVYLEGRKPTGIRVQWLRSSQPDLCKIRLLNYNEIKKM